MAGAGWTVSIAIPLNNANIQQGLRTLLSHIFASAPSSNRNFFAIHFSRRSIGKFCAYHLVQLQYTVQYTIQYTVQVPSNQLCCVDNVRESGLPPKRCFVLCFSQCVTWTKIRDKKQLHCREFPWFVRSMYAVFRDKTQGSRSFFFQTLDFRFPNIRWRSAHFRSRSRRSRINLYRSIGSPFSVPLRPQSGCNRFVLACSHV